MIKMRVEKRQVFVSGASCLGIKHESYGISKKIALFYVLGGSLDWYVLCKRDMREAK